MENQKYLSCFDADSIKVIPYRAKGIYKIVDGNLVVTTADDPDINKIRLSEWEAHGTCGIESPDMDFPIYFPVENGIVPDKYIELAKLILLQLDDMDATAKAVAKDEEYDECLSYIEISQEEIHLHYVAGSINAEWGAYFTYSSDGKFVFKGLG